MLLDSIREGVIGALICWGSVPSPLIVLCSMVVSWGILMGATWVTKMKIMDVLVLLWNLFFVLMTWGNKYDVNLYLFVWLYLVVDIGVNITCIILGDTRNAMKSCGKLVGDVFLSGGGLYVIFSLEVITAMAVGFYSIFVCCDLIGYMHRNGRGCLKLFFWVCIFFFVLLFGLFLDM
ncbi:MAG: hypothetical protein Hyperionvirus19_4 [Hyperionvirus sp.]|uniref:Uncharacterized protein n=1 Tax=Hyperionvirus sp. TaxID=2487770 RepID=A0A3G5AAB5_9VIRU|nr:MAG: hypothetical protein Hyperionvirus19_4 [Hyperionvirus sp.]